MKIALISCVKSKNKTACLAKDLYISPLFKKSFLYAKLFCDKVFILSAKYGLLEENEFVSPYEQTLNKMERIKRQKWAENILFQLNKKANLCSDEFVILAGEKYREFLIPHIKKFVVPFKGKSFGKQLQSLKEILNGNM